MSSCDFFSWITKEEESLEITNCIMWKQEWGEGWECPRNRYEIRKGNQLWIRIGQEEIEVGSVSENEITIKFNHKGITTHEQYRFEAGKLIFDWRFISAGKEWKYAAKLNSIP